MRKTILFLCVAGTSCCLCRNAPLIEERCIYAFDHISSSPEWIPQTHRDSLLWEASKEVKQSLEPMVQEYMDAEYESSRQLLQHHIRLLNNQNHEKRTSRKHSHPHRSE